MGTFLDLLQSAAPVPCKMCWRVAYSEWLHTSAAQHCCTPKIKARGVLEPSCCVQEDVLASREGAAFLVTSQLSALLARLAMVWPFRKTHRHTAALP